MSVLKWILVAITCIGCAVYVYGYWRERDEEPQEYKGLAGSFKDVFSDPKKKVRKIGTIIIYSAGILLLLVVGLSM